MRCVVIGLLCWVCVCGGCVCCVVVWCLFCGVLVVRLCLFDGCRVVLVFDCFIRRVVHCF